MNDGEKETYLLRSHLWGFKYRVSESVKIIKQALSMRDIKWAASVSFGKDSLVMLDLIQKINPVPVIYMWSPYKLPDQVETIEKVTDYYHFKPHIIHSGFGVPIETIWNKFGISGINQTQSQSNRQVKFVKKDPSDKYCKEKGFNGIFWGLRKEESLKRKWLLTAKGTTFETVNGFWRCAPLAHWTSEDIWAYIVSRNLAYPNLYDKEFGEMKRGNIRNTSWITTDGADQGRMLWLMNFYPNEYDRLLSILPKIREYV